MRATASVSQAFRPRTTGLPSTVAVVVTLPCVEAMTSVFPLALGVGSCKGRTTSSLPSMVTVISDMSLLLALAGSVDNRMSRRA